jgi:hypothetical protein
LNIIDSSSRQLGISEKCVRTTLANFKETGDVADKPRPGAPKKISERDKNTVYRLARQDPNKSVSAITAELNETLNEASVTRSYVAKPGAELVLGRKETFAETKCSFETMVMVQRTVELVRRPLENGNLQ